MVDIGVLKNKTILYADDDRKIRIQMEALLNVLFHKTLVASNGEEAFAIYQNEHCDILITDIKMPKKDGLKLVESIRRKDSRIPIVLLTSFSDQEFLLRAANLSVDGYIVKPIDFDTLINTIDTALRRTKIEKSQIRLNENLVYSQDKRKLYHNNKGAISLTAMELKLLDFLISNQNITLTKEEIAEELWPLDPICESAVKNMVLRLRKKLGNNLVMSIYGIGYMLNTEPSK